ncbi:ATP-binding protein [Pseudomonadota bacterium]
MVEHPSKWSHSLQVKFLLGNVPFVLLLVGVLVGLFEYVSFQYKFADLERKVYAITQLNAEVLEESLWNLDHERIDLIASSISTNDVIVGVHVLDDVGDEVISMGTPIGDVAPHFVKSQPISHVRRGGIEHPIGTLSIVFSDHELRAAAATRVWGAAGLTMLILLVSVVTALIINKRIIGMPLSLLIEEINRVKSGEVRRPVLWTRHDEIGQVIAAFNAMQVNQEEYEAAIRLANDNLERRVEDRTHELTVSENRFRDFTNAASDWYWEMGPDLRFISMSGRFEELVGLTAEDIIGRTRRDLVRADVIAADPEKWKCHFADLEAHKPFRDFEYEVDLPDGTVANITTSAVPVFRSDGSFKGYRGSGRNITEQAQAKIALQRAIVEAEAANKAKSEFLSSMSHELRTPLNAILGFAQILEFNPKVPLDEKQSAAVAQIKKGGEHLLELINDVLNLSKIESGRLSLSVEPVDSEAVVAECIDIAKTLDHTPGVSIDAEGFEGGIVLADLVRFKQVLLNLLSNAVKYNREGGSVLVSSKVIDDDALRISIIDTGPGIPSSKQSELFQPFSRLGAENSNIEGTGIGLTITLRLLEAMGGRIGFDSREGVGSTFWVDLPLAANQGDVLEQIHNTGSSAVGQESDGDFGEDGGEGGGRVLYVEDNPANIELMETILATVPGIDLTCVHTAELGLAAALKDHPDLILMDINLPGMNGFEALAELRARDETQSIPVIAISAACLPRDIQEGLDAGFRAYLTKPFNVAELTRTVTGVLGNDNT